MNNDWSVSRPNNFRDRGNTTRIDRSNSSSPDPDRGRRLDGTSLSVINPTSSGTINDIIGDVNNYLSDITRSEEETRSIEPDNANLNITNESDSDSEGSMISDFTQLFLELLQAADPNRNGNLSGNVYTEIVSIMNRIKSHADIRVNIYSWFSEANIQDLGISNFLRNHVVDYLAPQDSH